MLTNYFKQWSLSILTALAITILSLIPFPEVEIAQDIPLADKWVHFLMYGALSLVVWFEMARHEKKVQRKTALPQLVLWGLVLPAALGGLLELAQEYLTTTRSGDVWDFIADAIGAVLGTILGIAIRRIMR